MAQKNYLRLDKIGKTSHYETVVNETTVLLAGHLVNLGNVRDASEGEAVDCTLATTKKGADAIIAPVYIDKGYPLYDITLDSVPKGKPTRAIHFIKGDIISINSESAPGIAKGDLVTTGASGLGFAKADTTAASTDVVIGKCISVESLTNIGDLTVIRFA